MSLNFQCLCILAGLAFMIFLSIWLTEEIFQEKWARFFCKGNFVLEKIVLAFFQEAITVGVSWDILNWFDPVLNYNEKWPVLSLIRRLVTAITDRAHKVWNGKMPLQTKFARVPNPNHRKRTGDILVLVWIPWALIGSMHKLSLVN